MTSRARRHERDSAEKRAPDVANTTFNLCPDDVRIDGNAAIERAPHLVNTRLAVIADPHLGDLRDMWRDPGSPFRCYLRSRLHGNREAGKSAA
jgi:hypothetical protein